MLLSFLGPSARCQWGLSPSAESALTSVVFAGMLLGVYSLGAVADSLGRRRGFLASALLLGVSGLASALAPSFGVGTRTRPGNVCCQMRANWGGQGGRRQRQEKG